MAVDLDGRGEVMGVGPPRANAVRPDHGLGWTIDWLSDGRLLVTGKELLCVEANGSASPYADVSGIWGGGWNDIVVDGRGKVYVCEGLDKVAHPARNRVLDYR